MPRFIEGNLSAEGLRLAIVASRFNDPIVAGLLQGALDCLERHGGDTETLEVFRVPGAFEIPTLAAELAVHGGYDAIVTLGALIRGDTPHFDHISAQATTQISRVSIDAGVPISFGVITCETMEQALQRSGPGSGNKGWEAALAAIEMANLWRALRDGSETQGH
jgi:6,7-dimethyl-8-ribityllumazine synthase